MSPRPTTQRISSRGLWGPCAYIIRNGISLSLSLSHKFNSLESLLVLHIYSKISLNSNLLIYSAVRMQASSTIVTGDGLARFAVKETCTVPSVAAAYHILVRLLSTEKAQVLVTPFTSKIHEIDWFSGAQKSYPNVVPVGPGLVAVTTREMIRLPFIAQ